MLLCHYSRPILHTGTYYKLRLFSEIRTRRTYKEKKTSRMRMTTKLPLARAPKDILLDKSCRLVVQWRARFVKSRLEGETDKEKNESEISQC